MTQQESWQAEFELLLLTRSRGVSVCIPLQHIEFAIPQLQRFSGGVHQAPPLLLASHNPRQVSHCEMMMMMMPGWCPQIHLNFPPSPLISKGGGWRCRGIGPTLTWRGGGNRYCFKLLLSHTNLSLKLSQSKQSQVATFSVTPTSALNFLSHNNLKLQLSQSDQPQAATF